VTGAGRLFLRYWNYTRQSKHTKIYNIPTGSITEGGTGNGWRSANVKSNSMPLLWSSNFSVAQLVRLVTFIQISPPVRWEELPSPIRVTYAYSHLFFGSHSPWLGRTAPSKPRPIATRIEPEDIFLYEARSDWVNQCADTPFSTTLRFYLRLTLGTALA